MSIQNERLNSNFFSDIPLEELNNLLITSEAKVTLWGTRLITVPGYDTSAPLWDVARKAVRMVQEHLDAPDATPLNQRLAGMTLAKTLCNFVEITDKQIANSNFFTRFLAWAKDQFEELFGGSPRGTACYIRKEIRETKASVLAASWLVGGKEYYKDLTEKWAELGYTLNTRTPEEIEHANKLLAAKEENTSEEMGVLPPLLFCLKAFLD